MARSRRFGQLLALVCHSTPERASPTGFSAATRTFVNVDAIKYGDANAQIRARSCMDR
jgi:hypothetical protein